MPRRVPPAATVVVLAVVAVAVASAVYSGRGAWHRLSAEHTAYSRLSGAERGQAPLGRVGVPGAAFDFFSEFTVPGDRIYFQTPGRARQTAFATAGRFYLFPAVLAKSLGDATVVLSYHSDPAALNVHFVTQKRDGTQKVYVSRIGVP